MKKKKVFLTRTLHDFALTELEKKYKIEIHKGNIPISSVKLKEKIGNIDGLICFPYDIIGKEVIDAAKCLKVISTYSVGFDHIDTDYAKKKKIRVGYTPEVLTDATADLAFALILDVMRRVSEGDRIIRSGKWRQIYGAYDYVGVDLKQKTLGIFGLGRIGTALARRAKAFDMKIIYHNRNRLPKAKENKLGVKHVSFEKLITDSDVLSLHVPHTKETDGIINEKIFKKMKNSAYLINTARGKIVNQKDLVYAIRKNEIAGAGMDVFEEEPINSKNPLLKLEKVVLAPHIGSSTKETRAKMAEITVKNLNLGIEGRKPAYSVGY